MKKVWFVLFILFGMGIAQSLKAQDYEKICSRRYNYCFQIPFNFFMLTTGDVESAAVSYKTVDGSSTLAISNGDLAEGSNFHALFLMQLGEYSSHNYRVTLKKEYPTFFVLSGYTASGKGFYQKVIKKEDAYTSAYLEFPKGNNRFSNISQLIYDYFEKTVLN